MPRAGGRLSARLDAGVDRRLADHSARGRENKSQLAERYIDEGMRMDDHPGIVFRAGPAGRRAALAVGPDVWEVMSVVHNTSGSGEARLRHAAEALDISPDLVSTAVRYYSEFPDEVDERIRRNREEAALGEAAWRRAQAVLG